MNSGIKAANPSAVYCSDPVMGDVVPAADIVTPNQFELEFITGRPLTTTDDVVAATEQLHRMGPDTVLVTSVLTADTPDGEIQMVCSAPSGRWLVSTPLLPMTVRCSPSGAPPCRTSS
jgi:pyridoxine kinase